jgi:AcrR family transcriptional regulator
MVRQARSEATRQTILRAAAEVFARMGYATATMRDNRGRLKAEKGAFYYHFDCMEPVRSDSPVWSLSDACATVLGRARGIQGRRSELAERDQSSFIRRQWPGTDRSCPVLVGLVCGSVLLQRNRSRVVTGTAQT